MRRFEPFADDAASKTVSGFTFENGTDKVAVYGNLDVTRDARGLKALDALLDDLQAVRSALAASPDLPDEVEGPGATTTTVKNPFA